MLTPACVNNKLAPVSWKQAIETVAVQLVVRTTSAGTPPFASRPNDKRRTLAQTARLGRLLGTTLIDIVPRTGAGDDILLSEDRNSNTNGARLLQVASDSGTILKKSRRLSSSVISKRLFR